MSRRLLIVALALLALVGMAVAGWWTLASRGTEMYTDAETIRLARAAASPREVLWRPPTLLDTPLNTDGEDYEPRFAWDGLTLFFVRGKAGENADILSSQRTAEGWTDPRPVEGVCSEYDDLGPSPSHDGQSLFFYSDRPGGQGGYDLWVARRSGDAWQSPTNLGPQVNSTYNEYGPAPSPDGGRLFFSSNRPQPDDAHQPTPDAWPATVREDLFSRTYDLYVAERGERGFSPATPVSVLNTPANEGAPCVSPSGDFLYFSSNRPGGRGGFDLYRARILRGVVQPPTALGDGLNTTANELDPGLTQLGFALYFSSDRTAPAASQPVARGRAAPYDLYVSTTREVFTERDAPPPIDWAALLAALWPNLLWLLLGLLLLILLLAMLRDMRDRRLSLLVRCLLLSLLLHLLMLIAFNFWRVSTSIAEALRRGEPIQVALASTVETDSLIEQVRGDVTDPPSPTAVSIETPAPPQPQIAPPAADAVVQTTPPESQVQFTPPPAPQPSVADAALAPPPLARDLSPVDAPTPSSPTAVALPQESRAAPTPEPPSPRPTPTTATLATEAPQVDVPASQPARLVVETPTDIVDSSLAALRAPDNAPTVAPSDAPVAVAPSAAAAPRAALPASPPIRVEVALPAAPTARLAAAPPDTPPTPVSAASPVSIRDLPRVVALAPVPTGSVVETGSSAAPARLAADAEPVSAAAIAVNDSPVPAPPPPGALSAASTAARLPPIEVPGVTDLRLPTEAAPVENRYAQRAAQQREALVEHGGGSDETEAAVARALRWLARHQSADGRWDSRDFDESCGVCEGRSEYDVDVALTGLALLCFMGANHSHMTPGEYQGAVSRGLRWLLAQQRADGDLRGAETLYSHGIATIALAEALALTGDRQLVDPVRRAVRFIEQSRNKDEGGWRYEPGQAGDTSVLGWQMMALHSAAAAGLPVASDAVAGARDWMERVSDPREPGLYSYRPGHRPTVSMTAEGMFIQQLLGVPRGDPRMQRSAAVLVEHLPQWRFANTYAWYYATLALFHHGGRHWETWNAALKPALLGSQRRDGGADGSWDPDGEWAPIGGRVYQTALCTLMLEVYYRYLPMYGRDDQQATVPQPGVLRGKVTDARTAAPLAGATVRLDIPGGDPLIATTAADGSFTLEPPAVAEFVAVTAAREGYEPSAVNVSSRAIHRGDVAVDFALEPESQDVIALDPSPEVHHLGNDAFEGAVNSQFQRESEGRAYTTTFVVPSDDPAAEFRRVELTLLAKGVQCEHPVSIGGRRVARLPLSPEDGSFGQVVLQIPVERLSTGINTLRIASSSCHGDLDDFEFVNVQIRLLRR